MFKKMSELVDDVIDELGLVSGSAVQQYTEQTVERQINKCFDLLFLKHFWKHLTETTVHALAGVDGVVTEDIAGITAQENIKSIHYGMDDTVYGYRSPLYLRSASGEELRTNNVDPIGFEFLSWAHPLYQKRWFRIIPQDTIGFVFVTARRHPGKFTEDSVVPMDYILLESFTTAHVLSTDGLNPQSETRHNVIFEQRYKDLIAQQSDHSIIVGRSDSDHFTVAGT